MDDTTTDTVLPPDHEPPVVEVPEVSARDKIRAFEDRNLGENAVRINGEVEKGHGSLFKELSPQHHRHYADLEKLAAAETALTEAGAALGQAQAAYDAAAEQAEASAIEEPEPQPEPVFETEPVAEV